MPHEFKTTTASKPYIAFVRHFTDRGKGRKSTTLMPIDRPGHTYYVPVLADTRRQAHQRAMTRAGRAVNARRLAHLGVLYIAEAEHPTPEQLQRFDAVRLPDMPTDHLWDRRNRPLNPQADPRLRRDAEEGLSLPHATWEWLRAQADIRGMTPSLLVDQALREHYDDLGRQLAEVEREVAANNLPDPKGPNN